MQGASQKRLIISTRIHSFEDNDAQILERREDRWFERWVKEAIHVQMEGPSLNMGDGLKRQVSATYNAVLTCLLRHFKPLSKLHMMAAKGNDSLMSHTWCHVSGITHLNVRSSSMSLISKQLIKELHLTCDPDVQTWKGSMTRVTTCKV